MIKRIAGILLSICVVVAMMPAMAFGETATYAEAKNVLIGGQSFANSAYYVNNTGFCSEAPDNWNAYYDEQKGELHLKDYNGPKISSLEGNLKIILEGTNNKISANKADLGDLNGIVVGQGDLIITGNSTLNIIAATNDYVSDFAGILNYYSFGKCTTTIDGATVNITVTGIINTITEASAIEGDNLNIINGAKVNITMQTKFSRPTSDWYYNWGVDYSGIYIDDDTADSGIVKIKDSTVNIDINDIENNKNKIRGIVARNSKETETRYPGKVEIDNSVVTINGTHVPIYAKGDYHIGNEKGQIILQNCKIATAGLYKVNVKFGESGHSTFDPYLILGEAISSSNETIDAYVFFKRSEKLTKIDEMKIVRSNGPEKPTLSVSRTYTYNGEAQNVQVTGYDYQTMNIENNVKTDAGTYTVSVTPEAGAWSDGSTDAATVEWTIAKKTPVAEDFDFTTTEENPTYDEKDKTASVTLKKPYSECGAITVEYYKSNQKVTETKDVGEYTVKISVAGGDNFNSASDITDNNWKLNVAKADQATPVLQGNMPNSEGTDDGKITGLDAKKKYEYKVKGTEGDYTPVGDNATVIENLAPATYLVRLSGDDNHNPSDDAEVIVRKYALTYPLTVLGGTASPNRELAEGDIITIVAEPPYEGKVFDKWIVMDGFAEVTFENDSSPQTTFKMPAGEVKISASYKAKPSGGSYKPSTPPVSNDGGNTVVDTKPVTTTTGGVKTTTANVNEYTGNKLVENAVKNESEEVVVDATTSNANASIANGAKTEVVLTENTVKELAEKTSAGLDIKTDNAVVSLDNKAVKEVANQAGTTGEIKLVVETVKSDAKEITLEVTLVTSNGAVTDFGAGNVKVTVPANQFKNKKVVCVYIDDEGNYTKMEGMLNADGTYTFVTNHFSTYAIMEEAEADKVIAEQNKAKLNDLIKEVALKATSVKTSKKNVKVTVTGDVSAITDLGYTVKYKFYRSEKKSSGYVAMTEKDVNKYTNTKGVKGTKYYYKARVMVYDGDELVAKTELKQCRYACRAWSK